MIKKNDRYLVGAAHNIICCCHISWMWGEQCSSEIALIRLFSRLLILIRRAWLIFCSGYRKQPKLTKQTDRDMSVCIKQIKQVFVVC